LFVRQIRPSSRIDRGAIDGEGGPSLEHVVHGPGDIGVAGELGALALHPGHELADQRSCVLAALGKPVGGGVAVDRAFVGEDRVDLADRLDG
jgi:hypothetical protein